jgi:ABC-type antimicrobial peptide transport system permease subunit
MMALHGGMHFQVRTATSTTAILPGIRAIVQGLDPSVPISDEGTQMQQVDISLAQERTVAQLSAWLGVLATFLVCTSVYGMQSYVVVLRTREIGIRIALGAKRSNIITMLQKQGFILGIVGILAGAIICLGATRVVVAQLYGVRPADPITIFTAICIIILTIALSSWIPVLRASRIEPMEALREE